MDKRPIGVFDSGLGGLTAVKQLLKCLPNEDIIYFGDTGRVPYGTRSNDTIIKYVKQDIKFLSTFNIKLILFACGTASTVALPHITADIDIPLIGVLEPACKSAITATKNGKIGVIATQGTIRSAAYEKKIRELMPYATVFSKACPLYVPIVENGHFKRGDIIAEALTREYLSDLIDKGIDTLILACTHYPLLTDVISEFAKHLTLIDSGSEAANFANVYMDMNRMKNENTAMGALKVYVSDYSPDIFESLASSFLERPLKNEITTIDIEQF